MVENNKYGIEDLITSTLEQRPTDFAATFDELLVSKLHNAINDKKLEVAQRMFAPQNEEEFDSEEQSEE